MMSPVVITQPHPVFTFKVKKETENLRFAEVSSLSKFTNKLGTKDRFELFVT